MIGPSGIYRCDIDTIANDFERESVYLGVYSTGGKSLCTY